MKGEEFENVDKALKEPILQLLWWTKIRSTIRFSSAFPQIVDVGEFQFIGRASQEPSNIQ